MDTKSFEVIIHSQYAFDFCREDVRGYEECRQTDSPVPRDPKECKAQARQLHECYKEAEKMEPVCLDIFNDARECMFKSDGHMYNCKEYLNQYAFCQARPQDYQHFLTASTTAQKQAKTFDFLMWRGHFDKYN